jgi:hypothetical protein
MQVIYMTDGSRSFSSMENNRLHSDDAYKNMYVTNRSVLHHCLYEN